MMTGNDDGVETTISVALQALNAALLGGDYNRYLALESAFYGQVVKVRETAAHHELCFSSLDPLSKRYGDILKSSAAKINRLPVKKKHICYLLPNIDNDLAHIEFLYSILKHHPVSADVKITIAGYTRNNSPPASRLIRCLASEGRISILKIPDNHFGRVQFLNYFRKNNYSQLVIFSIPLQLSAWVRALGPSAVAWATTKFELSAFDELENRISFSSAHGAQSDTKLGSPTIWSRSSAAIACNSITPHCWNGVNRHRLVTINREEKIRTPEFLEAVRLILVSEPLATFSWTGRSHDRSIQAFFDRAGIAGRCEYIGWVDPSDTIKNYDIFLDTFGLSGVVATRAFCSGMPVIFFQNSRAWIDFYKEEITKYSGQSYDKILADSPAHYSNLVLDLIRDYRGYLIRSEFQRDFSKSFFFDEEKMYNSHMQVILGFVDKNMGCLGE